MKTRSIIILFTFLLFAGEAAGINPQGSLSANGPFCATGAGQLTWTSTSGVSPFTIVYNDGVADRTATGVVSGAPFVVAVTPVTGTTTYIVQSVTGADADSRTGGFTNGSATITIHSMPLASAGGSSTICENGTATVSGASATNGTIAWIENGAGSITSGATTLTPTYTAVSGDAGNTVTLTMTITSNNSCIPSTATASYSVIVQALPAASAGGSQTICQNGTATVSGASVSNGTILWTENGAGTITAGANTLTPTYTADEGDAGNTVTLTMTVTSNNSCNPATATAIYSVIVQALPGAAAGGSQTICQNGTATVSGAGYSNGTILWTDNGSGSISSGSTTLTPTYTAAAGDGGTTVTLTMTVTSNNACNPAIQTATYTVIVEALPVASAGGSKVVCVNGTATVSGATASNGTVSWTENGAGSITSGANTLTPTYTAGEGDAGTTVTLTMTVTSNNSCISATATATYSVIVEVLPTASAGGSQTICQNGTATVSGALATNGTILWTENGTGSITSGATTLTPTYTADVGDAGTTVTLTMTVTSNNSCTPATASATYSVVVQALPTATAGGTRIICQNATATVSGASSTNGTILWTENGAGSITSGATTLTPVYTSAAGDAGITVTLTMTVTSNNTCTPAIATASYSVAVNPLPTLSGVSQNEQICSGAKAIINLTGLIGTSSSVTYKIGADAPVTLTGVPVTAGNASFLTGNLDAVNNGKSLQITSITNENTGCTATFTQSTLLIVNTATVPVISGDLTPCINSSVAYSTQSGMNTGTYIWTFSGGGTYTGGGTNDNAITVNWTSTGPQTITVNFTNSNGCTAAIPTPINIEVSALPTPVINGEASVCINSSGNVYSTLVGMSQYDWEITGGTINSGGDNSNIAVVTWSSTGSQNIIVNYENASGCIATIPTSLGVIVNPLPLPTFITAPSIVRVTSTGNVYSTQPGMNNYVWTVTGGGTITGGGTAVNDFVIVTWNTTEPQSVSVKYTNTNNCTASNAASAGVTVNALPSVSSVNISGTPAVGFTLTGHYSFLDGGGGNNMSTFRWLRNGTPVPGEILSTYPLTGADLNKTITFEVTPVSTVGPPNTGVAVLSAPTIPIENLSEIPVADQVCIEGKRAAGETLRGKYRYIHSKSEGATTYKWYLNGVVIPSATGIQYTLLSTDIDNNEEITFEVTPVSSNVIPVYGTAVPGDPLVKIPLLPNEYSVAVISVPLAATPAGGIFSGAGVTNGVFSPNSVGISVTPYTIQYLKTYVNSSTSCSQVVTKNVTVVANTTDFSSFKPVYCNDDLPDEIIVTGLPAGATSVGFSLTDPDAIVSETDWTVTIDPRKMLPGNNVDVLYFSYKDAGGSEYQINKTIVVDAVGTSVQLINLSDEYCEETPKIEIAVSGATPAGGTGDWTGSGIIISDRAAVSASVNVALGTPGKKYAVNYQYTTPLGCKSAILKDSVKVNPLPDPSFSLDDFYNFDGEDVPLIPVQSPGTFTGKGVVSGDRFSPAKAGLGERTINYYIKDDNGCSDDLSLKTNILKAEGTITGIPSVICYSDITYNVTILYPPSGITVTGFNNSKNTMIHTPGSLNAEYSVSAAGEGNDTLTFSYQLDGVDYWITKEIYIDKLDKVEIYGVSPGDKICDNIPYTDLELNTSKPGGIFTGQVLGKYIDPTKGVGETFVTYTYTNTTDGTSCSTSTTVLFTIIPAPVVSFVPKDVCIESGNRTDSTFFVNNTVSFDPVREWKWTFEKEAPTSDRKEPGFLYRSGGIHLVSLEVWTISGCNVTQTSDINLGIRPKADFTWGNDCFDPGAKLKLIDATETNLVVLSRTWNINNGSLLSSGPTTEYIMQDTGYVDVKYIVTTNYANCADEVSRRIYLRPTFKIQKDGFYFQNFEAGKAGWGKADLDTSRIWNFGTPDRNKINNAKSGVTAWYTRYESDKQGKTDTTYVVSPCFDFTNIQRPMITIQAFKIFEKNRNGAALQYKTEGSDWKYVGTEDDGINWYNSTLINGKPGGEKIGWTTLSEEEADNNYVQSSHALDELKGKKNLKFRLAYGSDGSSLDKEGIAFDDIWIGERTRKVLLEHFTNTFSKKGSEATAFVNKITKGKDKDIINIQYHTNFPDDDPFYLANPGDASARFFSYGLSKVPYSLIDGGYNNDLFASLSDYKAAPLDTNDLTRRTLLDSKFSISITPKISGEVLTVNSTVSAVNEFTSDNLILYLVVTEKEATSDKPAALGEVNFKNIFRKFIPDAGGIDLRKTWTKGDSFAIPEKTWVIENIKNNSDIEVIAFIQNSQTKEVYQAASGTLKTGKYVLDNSNQKANAIGNENSILPAVITFGIYPNPASDKLRIEFSDKLVDETDIRIFDFQGAIKKTYKVASGESELFIENIGLKAGIYLVRMFSDGVDLGFRKLIITGN